MQPDFSLADHFITVGHRKLSDEVGSVHVSYRP